jgi:hypothetical protein
VNSNEELCKVGVSYSIHDSSLIARQQQQQAKLETTTVFFFFFCNQTNLLHLLLLAVRRSILNLSSQLLLLFCRTPSVSIWTTPARCHDACFPSASLLLLLQGVKPPLLLLLFTHDPGFLKKLKAS